MNLVLVFLSLFICIFLGFLYSFFDFYILYRSFCCLFISFFYAVPMLTAVFITEMVILHKCYYYGRFYLFLSMSLFHQPADFKSMLANYINLHSFFRLNEFEELLNNIYILAQNLAAFNEVTQFLVSARN